MAVFCPHDTAVFLPDWETLPYERFSPHQDLVSERLSALWQIKSGAADVLFVPVATAMQKLPPVPFLAGRTFLAENGADFGYRPSENRFGGCGLQPCFPCCGGGRICRARRDCRFIPDGQRNAVPHRFVRR